MKPHLPKLSSPQYVRYPPHAMEGKRSRARLVLDVRTCVMSCHVMHRRDGACSSQSSSHTAGPRKAGKVKMFDGKGKGRVGVGQVAFLR